MFLSCADCSVCLAGAKKARKAPANGLTEFSVTIQRDGADIDTERLGPIISEWLDSNCKRGFFDVERGHSMGYLHFQGVVKMYGTVQVCTTA
jgi:hypothetical protein